ncbi:hypothetical protein EHS13_16870 [Paenibacillus psychroresistens]|uniref:Uncharacterized protein n=1 Tax=Paenibacillus psychroresistens TaxID=1778678 RepID=A0A6B8RLY0_9BACL|nr:hypothetical protein [Paenibacillus psychroresistens]QGQ96436.1 hypothetical protein EHS13_16870 [Paenibacillus psychroresistens]
MEMKLLNNDWNDFNNDISWFINPIDKITLSETYHGIEFFKFSESFISIYPVLSELLLKARVTNIQVNNKSYQLLGWSDFEGNSFGWLAKPPTFEINKPLCNEHKILLSNFGGITERWNETEISWLLNLNSALTLEDAEEGFQGWQDYIADMCNGEGFESYITPNDYIAFAFEANGNITLYHKDNSSIIMLAHDHCFEHIIPLEGYPEYTIYRINECPNFVSWVEQIAIQEIHRLIG